jgi:hypothetical protein
MSSKKEAPRPKKEVDYVAQAAVAKQQILSERKQAETWQQQWGPLVECYRAGAMHPTPANEAAGTPDPLAESLTRTRRRERRPHDPDLPQDKFDAPVTSSHEIGWEQLGSSPEALLDRKLFGNFSRRAPPPPDPSMM